MSRQTYSADVQTLENMTFSNKTILKTTKIIWRKSINLFRMTKVILITVLSERQKKRNATMRKTRSL